MHPTKVPYTNAIIDLCLPFKLNIAVIGKTKCGKSTYIESIIKLLTEKSGERSNEGTQIEKNNYSAGGGDYKGENITNNTTVTSKKSEMEGI